ncbi:MAG: hypothetical protein A2Z26_01210 [Deltaproteobacteria bacterium RBG_16_66_15]|nr:MAG: hypothetical protein A2Z26_01210 [Deltaproteobacteria bacterium RBG_16_66_15]
MVECLFRDVTYRFVADPHGVVYQNVQLAEFLGKSLADLMICRSIRHIAAAAYGSGAFCSNNLYCRIDQTRIVIDNPDDGTGGPKPASHF